MNSRGTWKKVLPASAAALAIAAAIIYSLCAILSDGRTYSRNWVDYLLLTFPLIKGLPLSGGKDIHYFYSAADGPRPSVNAVEFVVADTSTGSDDVIQYFLSQGLVEKSSGEFTRNREEVTIRSEPLAAGETRVRVEVLDYLN